MDNRLKKPNGFSSWACTRQPDEDSNKMKDQDFGDVNDYRKCGQD
jgi:hypothetical protein